ncbi:hypothetical protein MP228_008003 [Amoeboaphelidium protococcarum]|nr:hypothetical protein MP228_008003 [Amoeboaphelidium protococcarum]
MNNPNANIVKPASNKVIFRGPNYGRWLVYVQNTLQAEECSHVVSSKISARLKQQTQATLLLEELNLAEVELAAATNASGGSVANAPASSVADASDGSASNTTAGGVVVGMQTKKQIDARKHVYQLLKQLHERNAKALGIVRDSVSYDLQYLLTSAITAYDAMELVKSNFRQNAPMARSVVNAEIEAMEIKEGQDLMPLFLNLLMLYEELKICGTDTSDQDKILKFASKIPESNSKLESLKNSITDGQLFLNITMDQMKQKLSAFDQMSRLRKKSTQPVVAAAATFKKRARKVTESDDADDGCFTCGSPDHWRNECPQEKKKKKARRQGGKSFKKSSGYNRANNKNKSYSKSKDQGKSKDGIDSEGSDE